MYIVTSGMNPNEDCLEHHGVLGMKWGVHRYRDKSGNITKRGKKRFEKVANNPKLAAKDQKRASDITFWAQDRAWLSGENQKTLNQMHSLYKAINSGKVKAGKDFIVQKDLDFNLTGIKNTRKIIVNPDSNEMKKYTNGLGTKSPIDSYGYLEGTYYVGDGRKWLRAYLEA